MWIRVGAFKVKSGQAERLRTVYNGAAIPKVRAFAGNLGCMLLEPASSDGDDFLVVTIWNDQASAEAYEASGGAAEVVALVREFFAGPPTLRSYRSSSIGGLADGT